VKVHCLKKLLLLLWKHLVNIKIMKYNPITAKTSTPLTKKDACYRKAKAKYRVFPSAYASGYIAKCRKRGGKLG